MRLLGIDYGEKRVGLALAAGSATKPLTVIPNNKLLVKNVVEICCREDIDKVIIGCNESIAPAVRDLKNRLQDKIEPAIELADETLTTQKGAAKMLISQTRQRQRKKRIDAVAAAEILSAYLARGGDHV